MKEKKGSKRIGVVGNKRSDDFLSCQSVAVSPVGKGVRKGAELYGHEFAIISR